MGINITEIGQKVLDNNTNAANVFRKMYDLHYNPNPLDVPFEYIDENGNKVITTIPNVTNFRKRVWNDALSGMYKIYFVDETNGNDTNIGTNDNPFKTIQKAIQNIPQGGFGIIYLKNDASISTTVSTGHRHIVFRSTIDNENASLILNTNATGGPSLVVDRMGSIRIKCNTVAQNTYDDNIRSVIATIEGGSIWSSNNDAASINAREIVSSKLDIKANTRLTSVQGNLKVDYTDMTTADNTSLLCYINYYAGLALHLGSVTLNGNAITTDDYSALVTGIIKDADSGNPVNIISNINFSD